MRLLELFLAASAVLGTAAGRPTSGYVVHGKRDGTPDGFVRIARAEPDTPLNLRIGLTQRNLHRAEEFISDVSHPASANYGRHWTPEQVVETFAPSEEAVAETVGWLLSAGVQPSRISPSASRAWIKVQTTVGEAERLLKTEYGTYVSDDGVELVACESYSVSADVREHVHLITPTIEFDTRGLPAAKSVGRRDPISPKKKAPFTRRPDGDSLKNCSQVTTPACLRALYNIPKNVPAVPGNSYGVVEFAPQSYSQDDLNLFFSVYAKNVPNGTAPVVDGVDGGYMSDEADSGILGESNLDLSYAMSLVYPLNVTDYQVGDNVAWQPATNNNFLDAIDGTYCSFEGGDDPTWDAIYPHDGSLPGAYTGQPMCGTFNATRVISVSYGSNEGARPASYRERECAEYLKLGLMGVTVMFSSGDTGVAGLRGQCVNPDGSYTPVAADYGAFNPMFPGSCPWVTSVGGSALPVNGSVGDREVVSYDFPPSGGFSNVFALPAYQAAAVGSYYAHHDPGYNASVYNNTQRVRGFPDVVLTAQNFVTPVDGQFYTFSGTSASSPTFGAIVALVNARRIQAGKGTVGFLNPVLYAHPDMFRDVVEGDTPGCGTPGFSAVPGWDPASGLGTPNFVALEAVLLNLP